MLRFQETSSDRNSFRPGILHTILAKLDTQKAEKKRSPKLSPDLLESSGRNVRPLSSSDFPAIVLTRNDIALIRAFLDHYRRLGVTRFIIVDDRSEDGTREFLLAQPDVDLWTSSLRYGQARRGRMWREALFDRYGKDRWYLNIDSDEFLVFADHGRASLAELTQALSKRHQLRLAAPMLDMYPVGILDGQTMRLEAGQMPWDLADHFDGTGYTLRKKKRGLGLRGGPRTRLFGADVENMKYPLIYVDGETHLASNIHQPAPFERNFVPIEGILLHFKIFSDFEAKVKQTVKGGQHFNGAAAYRKIEEILEASAESLNFESSVSLKYEGVGGLISGGFLRDWQRTG